MTRRDSDFKETAEALSAYLKIDTLPLAIKFVEKFAEGTPAGFSSPSAQGYRMAFCQVVSAARKWGTPFALSPKDIKCGAALLSFGWAELEPGLDRKEEITKFILESGYMKDEETARKTLDSIPLLTGEQVLPYKGLLIAPLERCMIEEPDVMLIYGNPAQILRLIQSTVYMKGETVTSEAHVGLSCVSEMIKPMLEKKATFVLPGRGERGLGMAGNDEMCFALPASELTTLITGLKTTDEKGSRYPVTQYLFFEPTLGPVQDKFAKRVGSLIADD